MRLLCLGGHRFTLPAPSRSALRAQPRYQTPETPRGAQGGEPQTRARGRMELDQATPSRASPPGPCHRPRAVPSRRKRPWSPSIGIGSVLESRRGSAAAALFHRLQGPPRVNPNGRGRAMGFEELRC